ncbi:hypothetical protein P0L94_10340 [Microbacter sp. GSS18]|nr:hypothetical protein P0L94_10340 [Microbacter sp. GSS18]
MLATDHEVGQSRLSQLAGIGVQHRLIAFDHAPPAGFAPTFLGSLFLLDVVSVMEASTLIIIDPDVVCVGPLAPLLEAVPDDSVGVLPIEYAPDKPVNGLSALDAAVIHAQLGEERSTPCHFGGEAYVIPQRVVAEVRHGVSVAWADSLSRHERRELHFRTEEHVMNFALRRVKVTDVSPYVRRIWTAHGHRSVRGDERGLSLWHLPAEKERGFRSLRTALTMEDSWFWEAERDRFVDVVGRKCGLWGRSLPRLCIDLVAHTVRHFAKLLERPAQIPPAIQRRHTS